MSKTATFTTSAVVEWVKLFPRQMTETHTSSVTFMKQLTTIALGTILHTKNLFPADCFLVEKFCGMEVMSLKKNCTHEMAQFISEALVQAFDAFDKKYLDQLVVCFYEGECKAENILEYYVFQYTYNKDGVGIALNVRHPHNPRGVEGAAHTKFTFDHVRHKTEKMIQTCVLLVTQFGRKLPDNYDVSLRLYYNQDAPAGYQAPGYEDGQHESDHLAATLEEALHLGSVGTPYHELSTHLYIKEDIVNSREAIATQNPPILSQMECESFNDYSGLKAVSDMMDSCTSTSQECRIQCPCLLDVIDEEADDAILICQYCGRRGHALCYGVLGGRAGGVHCCLRCGEEQPARVGSDRALVTLHPHKRQVTRLPFGVLLLGPKPLWSTTGGSGQYLIYYTTSLVCVFRRVLEWCGRATHVSCELVVERVHVGDELAARCLQLLHAYGLTSTHHAARETTPRPILHNQLTKVMTRFFHNNTDFVDRLIAETIPHDTPRNPIDEILTPIEQVDLRKDTVVGHVVDPEQARNIDDTLKEYRDAIIMLNMKEATALPPLSGEHHSAGVESLRKRSGKRTLDASRGVGIGTKRRKSNDSSCRKLL